MRIFDKDGKINFVDENDVLVGFDAFDLCCENFGFFFSDQVPANIDNFDENRPDKLEELRFDPEFFEEIPGESNQGMWFDEGSAAVFRLTGPENRQVFLILYNVHNGYYSHGFSMSAGDKIIRIGNL